MQTRTLRALALAAVASGCGGGGGETSAGSGSAAGLGHGIVRLVAHEPADGAVGVTPSAPIVLEFDAPIALDSLGDEDTWLRVAGGTANLACTVAASQGGRTVAFTPKAPLPVETDCVFQLSGLTCDTDGRLLDATVSFGFRTVDATPPVLLSVDVAPNETGRSRTGTFTFTFSEAIAEASLTPASLSLRDVHGFTYPGSRTASGARVVFDPFADLPGNREFTLELATAVTDRSGNALRAPSTVRFTTAGDQQSPAVTTSWPANGATSVSPLVQPIYTFSESMDPRTFEPTSLRFEGPAGASVPFVVHSSADQRTLRVQPLQPLAPFRSYTLTFLTGEAAVTDVSGNGLEPAPPLQFTTGDDGTPAALVASTPFAGEVRVSRNAIVTLTWTEPLDPARIGADTVRMTAGGDEIVAVVEQPAPEVVRVTPVLLLPVASTCAVQLRGGHAGLRDLAGNVLANDLTLTFATSSDPALPRAMLLPPDGAGAVPCGACVSIVFDAPMDPATITADSVQLLDDAMLPVAGTLAIGGGGRVAIFTPASALSPSAWYRTRVRGGSGGVRAPGGNWFAADLAARFRTAPGTDRTPPIVRATVNGIAEARAAGLCLPPAGFTVDVEVADPGDQSIDMGSVEVLFAGAGAGPDPAVLYAAATVGPASFSVAVPASAALAAGDWTLQVRVQDLSGNAGTSLPIAFTVTAPVAAAVPFERTQVVWVRTDLDRDGDGTADFDEDLQRLGFATAGDPAGTNARVRRLLRDGIVAQANQLYGRGARGEPLGPGSVGLRFATREPIAVAHMQIALGGFDPEGAQDRGYGSESSGVLGRALYDHRNGNVADRNTATSPGLGVFPAEMWLYQARIHQQVWPGYQTAFAQRFRPLCPDMGGTPAGAHPLDAQVLAESFDYATAPSGQRARWLTIMQAADDWSAVIGVILAHEVGHAVGLVAPGPAPAGLFGDSSLHNGYAGAAEVMAPSVGYEAMVSLDYAFRDIDLAYLRHRVILR